jgi:hypothetical protein
MNLDDQGLLPPIFLVACPRSGTTLLQSLLASHPLVYTLPETKFFLMARPDDRYAMIRDVLGIVSQQLRPHLADYLQNSLHRLDLLSDFPRLPLISLYIQSFVKVLGKLTLEAGKQVWLEKTPEHIFNIPLIQQYLPNARFIHLVRNGDNVVASLYEISRKYPQFWGNSWQVNDCLKRWENCLEIIYSYRQESQHLIVRYENLVMEPVACLQRICSFLQIDFTNLMLENYGEYADRLALNSSRSVDKKGIVNNHSDKFREIFDLSQQADILEQLSQPKIKFLLAEIDKYS